jgi:hypothetical protein
LWVWSPEETHNAYGKIRACNRRFNGNEWGICKYSRQWSLPELCREGRIEESPSADPQDSVEFSRDILLESRKRPDIKAHPEVRKTFDTYLSEHQKDLPRLTPEKYEAVSGDTDGKDGKPVFNCIANFVRNEEEIIDPRVFVDKYDEFYGENGSKPLDTRDYSLLYRNFHMF